MPDIVLTVVFAAIFLAAGLITICAVAVQGRKTPKTARRHSPVRAWTENEIHALGRAMLEEGAIELWDSNMAHRIAIRRPACTEGQMRAIIVSTANDGLWARRGVRPYGRS